MLHCASSAASCPPRYDASRIYNARSLPPGALTLARAHPAAAPKGRVPRPPRYLERGPRSPQSEPQSPYGLTPPLRPPAAPRWSPSGVPASPPCPARPRLRSQPGRSTRAAGARTQRLRLPLTCPRGHLQPGALPLLLSPSSVTAPFYLLSFLLLTRSLPLSTMPPPAPELHAPRRPTPLTFSALHWVPPAACQAQGSSAQWEARGPRGTRSLGPPPLSSPLAPPLLALACPAAMSRGSLSYH